MKHRKAVKHPFDVVAAVVDVVAHGFLVAVVVFVAFSVAQIVQVSSAALEFLSYQRLEGAYWCQHQVLTCVYVATISSWCMML